MAGEGAIVLLLAVFYCTAANGQVMPEPTKAMASHKEKDLLLGEISDITTGNLGSLCIARQQHRSVAVPLKTDAFEPARQKADLLAKLLVDLGTLDDAETLKLLVVNLAKSEPSVEASRIVVFNRQKASQQADGVVFMAHADRPTSPYAEPWLHVDYQQPSASSTDHSSQSTMQANDLAVSKLSQLPWFDDPFSTSSRSTNWAEGGGNKFMANTSNLTFRGWWTYPYYLCSNRKWQMTYLIPVNNWPSSTSNSLQRNETDRMDGLLSVDVSVSSMDVNQCAMDSDGAQQHSTVISHFAGTHKCHETSACRFERGHGWIKGGYTCNCLKGFYSPELKNASFNGSYVELAFRNKMSFNSDVYDKLYRCLPCAPGCDSCHDDSPCLAPYDWSFRIILLSISMAWIVVALGLMGAVYRYRRLKVFKVASPVFLCVTLLGCAIMYAEMAAIFPVLNTPACVATKWTRHMGFCITFSSLLMKTWRVSLTYRVKSAHKLKLTDQQLLHWMLPILLVGTVYLGAWTASDPPAGEWIYTGYSSTMKFTQCTYNWWDHSLAIGEMFFLMWGIQVCYSVRHAETYFNETKHISWAVYNIALVNIVMASFHLLLLPNVGPDMKYLFGFIRTQLSTTVTIALVFGPKFYLVFTGAGDEHDPRARARGVTASFSLNGISVPGSNTVGGQPDPDEPVDLYRENEELKEQLQKLAGHLEFMKIVHMGVNNPHLKPKPGGYFSQAQSQPPPTTIVTPTDAACLLRRGTLSEVHSTPAVVHFDLHLESDVTLMSRKNSSTVKNGSSGGSCKQSPPPPALASLGQAVDDVMLDDSPTAELLPADTRGDGGGKI